MAISGSWLFNTSNNGKYSRRKNLIHLLVRFILFYDCIFSPLLLLPGKDLGKEQSRESQQIAIALILSACYMILEKQFIPRLA